MKNYRDSDYAANKYARGIVYRFADKTVEVTPDDYLRENPGKTEADFAELKALSDGIFLEQANGENRQTYKNVSIHSLEETDAAHIPSAEYAAIDAPGHVAHAEQRRELGRRALAALTETQRRRYLMYHVEGLSTWEIAKRENVNQSKIMNSLTFAGKKIKKVLGSSKK